jgi:hypothetical protein
MHGRSFLRRLTVWAMLGLHGLVASGLPLPMAGPPAAGTAAAAKLAGKDRSRPFPCMDKACGCDSAERCFSNCCCHTPAETLAWAKARRIDPGVLAALARRVAAAQPMAPAGSCCSVSANEPSCCEAATPAADSCCTAADRDATADDAICCDYQSLAAEPASPAADEAGEPNDPPRAEGVVVLRAMLACGGIVAQWAAACVSLPPPGIVSCELPWPCLGMVRMPDEGASGTGGPPDLPPPRDR